MASATTLLNSLPAGFTMPRGLDAHGCRDQRIHLHVVVLHRPNQFGDLLDAALVAPAFEVFDDRDQGSGIAETRVTDADGAGAREHVFDDILGLGHAANADDR